MAIRVRNDTGLCRYAMVYISCAVVILIASYLSKLSPCFRALSLLIGRSTFPSIHDTMPVPNTGVRVAAVLHYQSGSHILGYSLPTNKVTLESGLTGADMEFMHSVSRPRP